MPPNFLFIQKQFYIFDCFFSHFLGIIVWTLCYNWFQALCTDVCTYQLCQNEYTTMYYHSDQSPHAILCISMKFFIAKADKMEDSQDLWSTNKATTAAILHLYNIFRQFLKLDSSFPKIKNMIIHKLGFQHCEKKIFKRSCYLKKL